MLFVDGNYAISSCRLLLQTRKMININPENFPATYYLDFFNESIDILQILVIALGAGLGAWGIINLLEGYGNDNGATLILV